MPNRLWWDDFSDSVQDTLDFICGLMNNASHHTGVPLSLLPDRLARKRARSRRLQARSPGI